jgi:hypothetical protein
VLHTEEVVVDVDEDLQEEFFRKVDAQLQSIDKFFSKEEVDLQFALSELEEKVIQVGMLSYRRAGKQRRVLKRALSETYLNLILLQNFQQLNHTGFRKILKKHDKLTQSSRGKAKFAQDVCRAHFWTSKKVTKMIEKVEKSMIQLEDGNRSKAMNRLRVPPLGTEHRRSHWTSYFAGLFSGLLILSIVVVCIAFSQWPTRSYADPHLEPSLRAMRAGLILSVWFYGFAINTFGWRRAGVNNVLIFEFNPRNYLNFVELFAVAGMISVIWITGLYLIAFAPWLHIPVYVGPLVMYGVLFSLLFLPLPVLRPRSRIWLLKRLGRIACAPFFPVTFADFWIADQLTSISLAMLDTEYFFCYLFYGQIAPEGYTFSCGTGTYGLRVMVAVLPAWWRFAQCMRRYYDTKEANPHLINAGKYSTSFFVVVFSAVASTVIDGSLPFLEQSLLYLAIFCLWVLSAVVSTSYTFSWDILMDWSLFPNIPQRCCRKKALTLREERIYAYKFYYVLALVEDFLFRILWIFNLSVGNHVLRLVSNDIIATVAGVLEIVRRFVWNFFRVENEHVTNVGQFRAVRDLSLYPVDLSGQADQEDNEDFLDRRGSLERGEARPSKKKRRKVTRKLSNALMEVTDGTGVKYAKGFRKRKRTVSATLPAELREIAADEDMVPGSPLLGYEPCRISRLTPSDDDNDVPTESCQGYDLVYGSSPRYGNPVLEYPESPQQYHADVFLQDDDVQHILTDVELTAHHGSGTEGKFPPPLYLPREKGVQDSGSPPPSCEPLAGLSATHDNSNLPTSRDIVSTTHDDLVSAQDSGAPMGDSVPPSQDSSNESQDDPRVEDTNQPVPHGQPYIPTTAGIRQSVVSPPSPTQEDVQMAGQQQTQDDTDLQTATTTSSLSQDDGITPQK